MFHVLIVEDDRPLARLYSSVLEMGGYRTRVVPDGTEALDCLEHHHVDLIITDVMLPRLDGCELTRQLRESGYDMPILMVTARETLDDKQQGFGAGADDYMVKPIDVREMELRVEALLRRARIVHERRLTVGDTRLDYDTLTLCQGGRSSVLPQKEFYLLYKLLSYPERIFTRQQLMDEIWGPESSSDSHTVDVHIGRLREHLRHNRDIAIQTIRGLGYKGVKLHG